MRWRILIMILGIDLGTTYSVGAYIDKENDAQVILNSEGKLMTPSVVLVDSENEIIVGDVA
ncbi:MAG: Hsp70 family protein, partial [Lachnospiraceae bacterium]|nr:Hsp70 family protein [Lachnospiraceae bacterium]